MAHRLDEPATAGRIYAWTCPECGTAVETIVRLADRWDPLGAAWTEAEAALPDEWWIESVQAWKSGPLAYRAEAVQAGDWDRPTVEGVGPTPALALVALAANLRARTDAR